MTRLFSLTASQPYCFSNSARMFAAAAMRFGTVRLARSFLLGMAGIPVGPFHFMRYFSVSPVVMQGVLMGHVTAVRGIVCVGRVRFVILCSIASGIRGTWWSIVPRRVAVGSFGAVRLSVICIQLVR